MLCIVNKCCEIVCNIGDISICEFDTHFEMDRWHVFIQIPWDDSMCLFMCMYMELIYTYTHQVNSSEWKATVEWTLSIHWPTIPTNAHSMKPLGWMLYYFWTEYIGTLIVTQDKVLLWDSVLLGPDIYSVYIQLICTIVDIPPLFSIVSVSHWNKIRLFFFFSKTNNKSYSCLRNLDFLFNKCYRVT